MEPCRTTFYKVMKEVREPITWVTSWRSSFYISAKLLWYEVYMLESYDKLLYFLSAGEASCFRVLGIRLEHNG
jgi:hypothetical protein